MVGNDPQIFQPQISKKIALIGESRPFIHIRITGARIDALSHERLTAAMKELTDLENPNSVVQMRSWLSGNGLETQTLGKKTVAALIDETEGAVSEALLLRQQLAKSSVKKYQAMENAACLDDRCRGMFQFYGANRTGRFSGRLIQLQNLPQNHMEDLDQARALVRDGNMEVLDLLYNDIPDTLSQLIRTAIIPAEGKKFYVADFSAIEARVIAWLAGEEWRNKLFAAGGDIYCQSASEMFKVPVEKHGINGHLRQKGKIAELACIAEDSLVLTDHGLIAIQDVSLDDRVWDGESWVQHEGVVFRGEREVITFEGLTATPDHLVWIEGKSRPVQFRIAAASRAHLVQTGNGGDPIRLGEDYQPRKAVEQKMELLLCVNRMSRLWKRAMAEFWKSKSRKIERLSKLFSAEANPKVARSKTYGCKTTLRESICSRVCQLWWKGDQLRFSICYGSGSLSDKDLWDPRKIIRIRSDRYERKLCTRKSEVCHTRRKQSEQDQHGSLQIRTKILAICENRSNSEIVSRSEPKRNNTRSRESCDREEEKLAFDRSTARVYDIRNAGRHHRFTVSSCLVHNCGYGGSVGALKAMGALEMGLAEEELKPLVDAWRQSNPHIVRFWWDVDTAVKKVIREKQPQEVKGIKFFYQSGILFIRLPSGRTLSYIKPRIGENRFGGESVTYEGIGATKKWERIESFSGKFVENIVQGTARDILMYAMKTLRNCSIVAHVHDEIIIEADPAMSLEVLCQQMAKVPSWVDGLILRADGYVCDYYKKD